MIKNWNLLSQENVILVDKIKISMFTIQNKLDATSETQMWIIDNKGIKNSTNHKDRIRFDGDKGGLRFVYRMQFATPHKCFI